eukprot:8412-Heterococcus_DN1.PRE.2
MKNASVATVTAMIAMQSMRAAAFVPTAALRGAPALRHAQSMLSNHVSYYVHDAVMNPDLESDFLTQLNTQHKHNICLHQHLRSSTCRRTVSSSALRRTVVGMSMPPPPGVTPGGMPTPIPQEVPGPGPLPPYPDGPGPEVPPSKPLPGPPVPKPDSPIPPLPDCYNVLSLHHMVSMLSFTARIVSCTVAHSADASLYSSCYRCFIPPASCRRSAVDAAVAVATIYVDCLCAYALTVTFAITGPGPGTPNPKREPLPGPPVPKPGVIPPLPDGPGPRPDVSPPSPLPGPI